MASTLQDRPTTARTGVSLPRRLGQCGTLYAVIGVCYLPMLALETGKLWRSEHRDYFPLLLAAIGYLLWRGWRDLPRRPSCQPTRSSLATLLISMLLLLASVVLRSPWLGTVAAIVGVLAILLSFGPRTAARLAPAWVLLWLLLPLPFRWDDRLILWLQGVTAQGGSQLLDAWGWDHVLAGYVLEIPQRQFQVEEIAAGVQSLFLLIAVAAVLAVWLRRPLLHGLLLVGSAPLWGTALNMFGVALIVALTTTGGADATRGWTGSGFAFGLLAAQLLILFSADRLLLFFLLPTGLRPAEDEEGNLIGVPQEQRAEEDAPAAVEPLPESSVPSRSAAGMLGLGLLTAAFLSLGALQGLTWSQQRPRTGEPGAAAGAAAHRDRLPWSEVLSETSLPKSLGAWQAVEFRPTTRQEDSDLGRYSYNWRYADARDEAAVSLDSSFSGWHDRTSCYEVRGWEIESRTVVTLEGARGTAVEVRMRDASGQRGYLLFQQFTDAGQTLAPPTSRGWSLAAWGTSLRERILNRFGQGGSEPGTLQIQLLVTGYLPLNEDQQTQARQAFTLAVDRLAERLWGKMRDEG